MVIRVMPDMACGYPGNSGASPTTGPHAIQVPYRAQQVRQASAAPHCGASASGAPSGPRAPAGRS